MTQLLIMVLLGHLWGDWIFQTDWQAANKALPGWAGWRANLQHVFWYTVVLAVSTCGARITIAGGLILLLASAVTHSILDRRWPVRWFMRASGSPQFAETTWGVIVTDQALHLIVLLTLVSAVGRP